MTDLIGHAPDPVMDRSLLTEIRAAAGRPFDRLVAELQMREDWHRSRLGALLPGLDLLGSPPPGHLLGVRGVNALGRGGLISWAALAGASPRSLAAIPGAGPRTVEEILGVAVREWAGAYLRPGEDRAPSRRSCGGHGAYASGATRASDDPRDLARAFEALEDRADFEVLRRRQLEPGAVPPRALIATELGISTQRVGQMEQAIRRLLSRLSRADDSAIGSASRMLRVHLGSVAPVGELDHAFTAIDPLGVALPVALPHRRALLLRLAAYEVTDRWVLGEDIETLTGFVLGSLTEDGPAELDRARRHLAGLGVRDEVQLVWIAEQRGFRIADGKILRSADYGRTTGAGQAR